MLLLRDSDNVVMLLLSVVMIFCRHSRDLIVDG